MSIANEFQKLQTLHDSGTLTDAEFADAKAKVLAAELPQPNSLDSTQQDIRRLQIQNELLRLD